MSSADRRIAEMIERWLASLDLHLKYVDLDDAAYWRVQPWPEHDRPNRWVLELARQKVIDLNALCEARAAMGDVKFAEALEGMAFLANLVGLQNVKRYVPLASANSEHEPAAASQTVEQPTRIARAPEAETVEMPAASVIAKPRPSEDATREMPRLHHPALTPAKSRPQAAPATRPVRAEAKKAPAKTQAEAPASGSKLVPLEVQEQIVTDAIRLIKWGRDWHELAELISRMADRPPIGEVRRVLRAHKQRIESQSKQGKK